MSLRGSDSWLDLGAGLSKMNTMDMDKNNKYGNVLLAIIRDIYNEKMVVEHDSIDHITIEMLVKAMNIGQYRHNADEGNVDCCLEQEVGEVHARWGKAAALLGMKMRLMMLALNLTLNDKYDVVLELLE